MNVGQVNVINVGVVVLAGFLFFKEIWTIGLLKSFPCQASIGSCSHMSAFAEAFFVGEGGCMDRFMCDQLEGFVIISGQ